MAIFVLELIPWKKFCAVSDKNAQRRFLEMVAAAAIAAFKGGAAASGSKSSPGQYPAIQSGRLIASLSAEVGGVSTLEVGTNMFYSVYLRGGTRKMARRKMSDNALEEGLAVVRPTFKNWAKWEHGSP